MNSTPIFFSLSLLCTGLLSPPQAVTGHSLMPRPMTKGLVRSIPLQSGRQLPGLVHGFTLTIHQVKNATAKIHVGFYRKEDHFPEQGKGFIIKTFTPEKTGSVSVTWTDIPAGEYAIALYQDINGDNKINKNFIGYPKEPFCFSRDFKPKLSPPKFEDCRIVFDDAHEAFAVSFL